MGIDIKTIDEVVDILYLIKKITQFLLLKACNISKDLWEYIYKTVTGTVKAYINLTHYIILQILQNSKVHILFVFVYNESNKGSQALLIQNSLGGSL